MEDVWLYSGGGVGRLIWMLKFMIAGCTGWYLGIETHEKVPIYTLYIICMRIHTFMYLQHMGVCACNALLQAVAIYIIIHVYILISGYNLSLSMYIILYHYYSTRLKHYTTL